jgi:D-beta-D-heptose 7-phosphate kinase/D-beta-D-heptose 1-phosphate adenosyltransferase
MQNLASLGATVRAVSVIGNDGAGESTLTELARLGIDAIGIAREPGRVSTRKSRLMSHEHGQQVFRFDEETQAPICAQTEDALIATLTARAQDVDAILCSDYLKGVLTPRVLGVIFQLSRKLQKVTIVGPKDSDANRYRFANVLVPNAKELSQLAKTERSDSDWVSTAAEKLMREIEVSSLLVTRGGEGMSLFRLDGNAISRVDIPTVARSVYDVTGAGDTVISVFTLAIASGAEYESAARLANVAAGIVVGQRGTGCVTQAQLLERIHEDPAHAASGSKP